MKLLLFPVFLVLLGCGGKPQDTPEAAARIAFESLKKNDFGIYLQLCISVEDLEWLNARRKGGHSPSLTKRVQGVLDGFKHKEHYRKYAKKELQSHEVVWKATRDRASKDFSWEKAEFHSLNYEDMSMGKSGWCGIAFLVEAEGRLYRFDLSPCVKVGRGFISLIGLSYLGRK